MTGAREELEVRLDPESFSRLVHDIRDFDRQLYSALRKRLRGAGDAGAREVKAHVLGGSYKTDVGLRRGIAAGVKVSLRTGLSKAGVSITASGARLPAARQAMLRAFNKSSFRHPTFGNRAVWVTESGRPYFGVVLYPRRMQMRDAVEQAMTDAAHTIREGTVKR